MIQIPAGSLIRVYGTLATHAPTVLLSRIKQSSYMAHGTRGSSRAMCSSSTDVTALVGGVKQIVMIRPSRLRS